jgi:hypothetical protein
VTDVVTVLTRGIGASCTSTALASAGGPRFRLPPGFMQGGRFPLLGRRRLARPLLRPPVMLSPHTEQSEAGGGLSSEPQGPEMDFSEVRGCFP